MSSQPVKMRPPMSNNVDDEVAELKLLVKEIVDNWEWWLEYSEDRDLRSTSEAIVRAKKKLLEDKKFSA